jgi:hypothetical protein
LQVETREVFQIKFGMTLQVETREVFQIKFGMTWKVAIGWGPIEVM